MRTGLIVVIAAIVIILIAAGVTYAWLSSAPGSNPCPGISTSLAVASDSGNPANDATIDRAQGTVGAAPAGPAASRASSEVIRVVAAENFWGSLVSQIGGVHVNVLSIVSDPNTDPHEYQANESDAIAISQAQYVILNNVGYDTWASAILAADGNSNQTVLNVGDSLGVDVNGGVVTGNPHLWYNPAYVNETVGWMLHNLSTIATSLAGYFQSEFANLTASLGSTYSWVTQIHDHFAGTEVASTESIFVYLANATGLDLVSPPAFMQAVSEGNDPPDSSVVEFQCQLESGHVRVLVYNSQTVTPLTSSMEAIAEQNNVSVMSVTETIQPPTASYQTWMTGQLLDLYNALNARELGQ